MDLAFTPEELAFREEIRAWVKANLPADISQKVHGAMRLSREDLQRWAKNSGQKGLARLGLARAIWRTGLDGCAKAFVRRRVCFGGCAARSTFWAGHGGARHHGFWQCRTTKAFSTWHCKRGSLVEPGLQRTRLWFRLGIA